MAIFTGNVTNCQRVYPSVSSSSMFIQASVVFSFNDAYMISFLAIQCENIPITLYFTLSNYEAILCQLPEEKWICPLKMLDLSVVYMLMSTFTGGYNLYPL